MMTSKFNEKLSRYAYTSFLFTMFFFNSCKENKEIVVREELKFEKAQDSSWMKLSLREKIGQIVCYKYNANEIQAIGEGSTKKFLQKYPVGSVFLANWEITKLASGEAIKDAYIHAASELQSETKYPLLISEDFESGLGSLIPQYTQLTTEMGLGATGSEEYASWFGDIIASESRSIGVNWLLHPVADLSKNPFNFLTNIRATGDDEKLAMKLLPAQINAMQSAGVAATAKHFPGDGTDYLNQHFATSTMKLSYEDWKKQHGAVFKKLIDEGVMTIMPGHIIFPDYQKEKLNDEYLPATLSREVMVDLLKGEMGFEGVIVSDALNMGGFSGYYKNQFETEIESFKAGTDILLWPQLKIIDTLEARILRKEIPMSRLNDAVNRVWNLKVKLGLFDENYQKTEKINDDKIDRNRERAYEISKKSITLLSNKNSIIPFNAETSKNILLVVVSENDKLEVFNPLKKGLEEKGFNVTIQNDLSFFENERDISSISEKYDRIIFNFYAVPNNPWGSLSLKGKEALTMWSANYLPFKKVITIGYGDPYKNLIYLPRIWARVNCYNVDVSSQKALVEGLIGEFEFSGKSPVNIQ